MLAVRVGGWVRVQMGGFDMYCKVVACDWPRRVRIDMSGFGLVGLAWLDIHTGRGRFDWQGRRYQLQAC